MSRFDDMMAEIGRPALQEHLGVAGVVVYDPEGDAVALTAILGPVRIEEDESPSGYRRRQIRNVTIGTDPDAVGGGVAAPVENVTVSIDSQQWAIEAIESLSAGMARLRCLRIGSRGRARPGYRTER